MNLQRIILYHGIRPDGRHQFFLGDQSAFGIGKYGKKLKRLSPDQYRSSAIQQLTERLQGESANSVFPTSHHVPPVPPQSYPPTGWTEPLCPRLADFRIISGRIKRYAKDWIRPRPYNSGCRVQRFCRPPNKEAMILEMRARVEQCRSIRRAFSSLGTAAAGPGKRELSLPGAR